MGDRSYFQLHIYGFGRVEDLPEVVMDVVDEAGLTLDWARKSDIRFVHEECSLDTYEEVADQLIGADPTLMFQCWNDPKYEYMGGIVRYTPTLGRFEHDCDSSGTPMFSADEVLAILAERPHHVPNDLGIPWVEEFAPFQGAYTEAP